MRHFQLFNIIFPYFQEFKFLRKIYPSKGHRRTDSGNIKAEMSKDKNYIVVENYSYSDQGR